MSKTDQGIGAGRRGRRVHSCGAHLLQSLSRNISGRQYQDDGLRGRMRRPDQEHSDTLPLTSWVVEELRSMRSRNWIAALVLLCAIGCGESAHDAALTDTSSGSVGIESATSTPDSQPSLVRASNAGKRRVILILLDAARLDRFGYAGYSRPTTPVMDALGERGIVFLNHYSHATHTRESLPNLLYSRYFLPSLFPSSPSVPFDTPENLFRKPDAEAISLPKALEQAGFTTAAISAHSWIKPGTRIADEFQQLQDLSGELHRYSPPADIAVDRSIEWIDAHRGEDAFLYLHLMDTHFPHAFEADARVFFGEEKYAGRVTGGVSSQDKSQALSGADRRYLDALYDGSLRSTDREIGRLVEFLRRESMLDETLIVITSDHGDHLLEHPGRFTHGGPWFETLGRIPLIVSYPKRFAAPLEIESFSELVDVAPTIFGLLDLPIPSGKAFDGQDQFAVAVKRAEGNARVLSLHGLRDARYKLLLENSRTLLAADEMSLPSAKGSLFDLQEDPSELQDLWSSRPTIVDRLVADYLSALRAPYRRFLAAKNHEQPSLPFAISSKHFETSSPITRLPPETGPRQIQQESQPGQWLRSSGSGTAWILAREGADPLDISFAMPDGTYEVVVHAAGGGGIQMDGDEPIALSASANSLDGVARPSVVGATQVENESFSATLIPPADGAWMKVTMLGFRPMRNAEEALDAIDPEHLEQLRALGYVE